MNEQRGGTALSTADMVAGMAGRPSEQAEETETNQPGDGVVPTNRPTEADLHTVQNGATATATTAAASGVQTPLLTADKTAAFRVRWDTIQASFVDEPRQAVEQADTLVAEAIKHLAEIFAQERSTLEGQWSRGNEVSTDALRLGLQRYRSFFQRLLAV